EMNRVFFTGNLAQTDGGAVANWSGVVRLQNAIFRDNRATRAGGAVFTLHQVELYHCTVWKNAAQTDSAAVVSNGGNILAVNSDFWGNAPASVLNLGVQPANVSYSNVEAGYPGEGNLDVRPGYRDPDNGDFRPLPDSPLIDQGTDVDGVDTDFRGFPRPVGPTFDIGAAEFFDVDGDGMEDDWEEFFGFDPADPADGETDLDGDGLTNAQEFALDTDPTDPEDPQREFFVAKDGSDENPGNADAPFLTIAKATATARAFGNTRAIHVSPGLYEEAVVLPPGVALAGGGADQTEIRHYDASDPRHVVVEMDDGATLRECRVSFPPLQVALGILVSMQSVTARVERVTIDGNDSLFSIGVSVRGDGAAPGSIFDSRIRRVHTGVQTLESALRIERTTFEGIRGDAVLVNLPNRKQAAPARVPVLGRRGVSGAGDNRFRGVVGHFVVNLTNVTVPAENNDWGLYTYEAIAAKMFGPVDFMPFRLDKGMSLLGCGAIPLPVGEGRVRVLSADAFVFAGVLLALLAASTRRRLVT
ncbi:MAG TPA: choice-of-anchor Q domain-containing protein, partial [Candidatus Hydrogenedentes bacterium]|nr:choice-of-anchor Q domain-containing protein [Candidatus Hydrogenedentota bacterium]